MNNRVLAVLVLSLVMVGGCSLDGPTRGSEPKPRVVPPPRAVVDSDAEPVQIFLSRGLPTDSDGDGYADTVPVVVYLFPRAEESQVPVWAEGEFEFRLLDHNQRLVARWVFPPAVATESRKRLPPGPGYSFFLRLGGEADQMPRTNLELSGVFRSASGRVISSQGSAALMLGSD